jgi:lysozyme family protein
MFNQMKIPEASLSRVDGIVAQIERNRARYVAVAEGTNMPWFVVGLLHITEAGGDFSKHLHNGDPLSGRTIRVPVGRPVAGDPPFTWEASAKDALEMSRMSQSKEWDVASTLWEFERYNGFGYRRRNVPSPYLWSCSDQYQAGMFAGDAVFRPDVVSKMCGIAPMLKRLIERNVVAAN